MKILALLLLFLTAEPRPSVYVVQVGDSKGTGVAVATINSQTLILTANHVVQDGGECKVAEWPGKVIKADATWDLAAIIIETTTPVVKIGNHKPELNEALTVCGFDSGPYKENRGQVIGYFGPNGQEDDWVSMSASGRSGDSGGPLFFDNGDLGAILFGSVNGRAYGTSCIRVRKFVESIEGYEALIDFALRG